MRHGRGHGAGQFRVGAAGAQGRRDRGGCAEAGCVPNASVAVSLFADDAHSGAARRLVSTSDLLLVSDLTAGEFSSALAIQYRGGRATEADVRAAYANFDAWCETTPERVEVLPSDIPAAQAVIRQLEHSLKLPDATHIVIARRLGAALATFDATMGREAPRLGLQLAEP